MLDLLVPPLLLCKVERPELLPFRANPTDAGMDLKSKDRVLLDPKVRKLIGTGVSVKIPRGFVGLLYPRSSLSKKGIMMTNSVGVIDSDYRGEIMASLFYDPDLIEGPVTQEIARDERIVQLVVTPIQLCKPIEYQGDDWNDTERGTGGFGSTGTH